MDAELKAKVKEMQANPDAYNAKVDANHRKLEALEEKLGRPLTTQEILEHLGR